MVSDWEIRWSNSKQRPYFFNAASNESVWSKPADITTEEIATLKGSEYLNSNPPAAKKEESNDGQVRASHLLVKWSGSRRPASWKDNNITRSKAEALDILNSYKAQLDPLSGQDLANKFSELASEHSDCSSHSHGGDLNWFGKGQMQKPFEQATFGIQKGQMSDVVETDSGVHLILRTG